MTSTDRPHLRSLALFGTCLLATLAAYGFTANDFFVSDDFGLLLQAQRADTFISAAGLADGDRPRWVRPLVDLTWWLCYRAFDSSLLGHHALNLLLHASNAWLVGLLVFRLTTESMSAYIAAVLFAVFPIHSEAVVWLSGRYDLLCATGYLISLCLWTLFCSAAGRWFHLLGAMIAFGLALLSKEMAVSLPLVAGAIAVWLYRPLRKQTYAAGLVFILILAAYLVFRYRWFGGLGGYRHEGQTVHNAFDPIRAIRFVFRALYYSLQPTHRRLNPHAWSLLRAIPSVVMLAMLVIALKQGRLVRSLPWLLLFLLTLIPLVGWAALSRDNQSARFLYLPSVFICAMYSMLLAFPVSRLAHKRYRGIAIVVVVGAYLVGAIQIATTWHQAAGITRETIDRLRLAPKVWPELSRIVATNPPDHSHGAYVFRNGLQEAVVMFVAPAIQTEVLARMEWEKRRAASAEKNTLFLSWDSEGDPVFRPPPRPR